MGVKRSIEERNVDRRAVTPVVGIIFLVAVAVVVGATAITFVLLIGDTISEPAPKAVVETEQNEDGTISLRFVAGETLDRERIELKGGEPRQKLPKTVSAGEAVQVVPSSDTVRLIWRSEKSTKSAQLLTVSTSPHPLAATGVKQTWAKRVNEDALNLRVKALEVVDGVLYSGAGFGQNTVAAVDASEGEDKLWEHEHHGGDGVESLDVSDGVVYSGGYPETVVAADTEDGSKIWSHTHHSAPVLSIDESDGVVYSGSEDNTLVAADASDGTEIWSHTYHDGTVGAVYEHDGVVYSGGYDNTVIAADASDGTKLWETDVSDSVFAIHVSDGVVYTGTHVPPGETGYVKAFDGANGSKLWQRPLHDESIYSIVEKKGVLYTSSHYSSGNTIVASDPADGSILWQEDINLGYPYGYQNVYDIAVADGKVWAGTSHPKVFQFELRFDT